jgi:hypothetical protein
MAFLKTRDTVDDQPMGMEVEAEMCEFVLRDVVMVASDITSVLAAVDRNLVQEIDDFIMEPQTLRDKLHSEARGSSASRRICDVDPRGYCNRPRVTSKAWGNGERLPSRGRNAIDDLRSAPAKRASSSLSAMDFVA